MANIMVVDDSSVMRKKLSEILTRAGHSVVTEAWNGEKAYREYVKYRPDLVTMDITMPEVNGITAVERIIEEDPEANIVMISALDQRSMVFSALQKGAKHYILKPFKAENVLDIIDKVLRERKGEERKIKQVQRNADQEVQSTGTMPFSIENRNGVFIISIHRTMNRNNLELLYKSVQGLLIVRPLTTVLDLGDVELVEEFILDRMVEIYDMVLKAGGTMKWVCSKEDLKTYLGNKTEKLEIVSQIHISG